ncbi:Segmentation protein even-skipped [Echinococcus granulosus]|uniref:Segmentation protein even-skipped n=1 Tax=Echinococcus granulosus TaxID=6210 RepID=W6VDW3_ECHGR|nr:Segmentation protein even-skipped [Echinococcus granulosus]EUB64944.1 Segmentation protein even-skipped [Echinococcus granulosus]
MYKPFSDTIASIPPFLTTFSHGELLSHLASGLATLDTSATVTAASTPSTSLCLCPYPTTAPPFPLPLPPLQLSFCCSPPSAPLLTSSPTPQSHHSDAIPAGTPASAIVAAEVKEQMPSASTSHLAGKRKFKETTMAGQMVVGRDIKRYRTTYSPYQSKVLEEVFQTERYISRPQRAQLATQLQLPENTIKVWFQNRRMKEKRQSMMLPSVAGSDPYLRETLLHVAKLYCDFHQKKQQHSQPAVEMSVEMAPTAVARGGMQFMVSAVCQKPYGRTHHHLCTLVEPISRKVVVKSK